MVPCYVGWRTEGILRAAPRSRFRRQNWLGGFLGILLGENRFAIDGPGREGRDGNYISSLLPVGGMDNGCSVVMACGYVSTRKTLCLRQFQMFPMIELRSPSS